MDQEYIALTTELGSKDTMSGTRALLDRDNIFNKIINIDGKRYLVREMTEDAFNQFMASLDTVDERLAYRRQSNRIKRVVRIERNQVSIFGLLGDGESDNRNQEEEGQGGANSLSVLGRKLLS